MPHGITLHYCIAGSFAIRVASIGHTPILGRMRYVVAGAFMTMAIACGCTADGDLFGGASDVVDTGDEGAGGGGYAKPRRPVCLALDPDVYRMHVRYCADWAPFPTATFCDGAPPPESCWAIDSYQRYDDMYCCCAPGSEGCDVYK